MTPDDIPIPCEERPLRDPAAPDNAASLVHKALGKAGHGYHAQLDWILGAVAQARFHVARAGTELDAGTPVAAAEMVRRIGVDLDELLAGFGVSADDPAGREWTAETRAAADVRGFQVRDDLPPPRVAYTECPAIYRKERLLAETAVSIGGSRRR
ncbi:hypothetical protein [Urbifossiella limnaea]|uniref:Uncharacterized protein n=1 Tax=Urbifossiella limnaea TaxID=2528023 RepID=A0A517XN72_9BACT|nr:hypothetical protein [Urbifossiella limnaea]QDU18947.1 hypothetical protein ETAA1_08460 [Urbifossiella limnaea]